MAKLMTIGNSGRKFPTSKGKPLQEWCSETEVYVKDMENYKTKCFKELSKQIFGVMIYAVKNAFRQYCKRDSKKLTDLIQAASCVNNNDQIATRCYNGMIDGVLGAQHAAHNKKIPHLCCEYVKTMKCMNENLTKAPGCNEKKVEAIGDIIRGVMGNIVDLVCGEYNEESDKCDTLGPTPKKRKSQIRPRSFAIPFLDLFSSFPAV